MSGYDVTSQFYDAMADEQHASVDAQIAAALRGLNTDSGPILDIGAGTGLTTRTIAAALPDAQILAIEPHAGMRAALMTRVWSDIKLKATVSIMPMPVFDAPLPAVISGAVASAVLVHFNAEERARLWKMLASCLAADGRIVVEVQCPEAVDVPKSRLASARVGRIDYEGYAEATALEGSRQRWRMTYLSLLEGVEIDRQVAEFVCYAVSASQVAEEVSRAGLAARLDGDLVVMERQHT